MSMDEGVHSTLGYAYRFETDKYYITTGDKGDGFYLIGVLRRLGSDEYTFEYLIDRDYCERNDLFAVPGADIEFPVFYMRLAGMDDPNRVYTTEAVKKHIFYRLFWEKGDPIGDDFVKGLGITEYNEWDILGAQVIMAEEFSVQKSKEPFSDSHHRMFFWRKWPTDAKIVVFTERRDWLD